MKSQKLIEEYEINPLTMIIMPYQYGSKMYSKIYELEEEFLSPFKPIDIIKKGCEFFGASYEGRKQGTKRLIGVTHKAPIAIAPTNFIYFFPTTSPEKPHCIWISHEHVDLYQKGNGNNTVVTFKNKKTVELEMSVASFQNQLFRTVMLRSKLLQRLEDTSKKSIYFSRSMYMEASENPMKYSN